MATRRPHVPRAHFADGQARPPKDAHPSAPATGTGAASGTGHDHDGGADATSRKAPSGPAARTAGKPGRDRGSVPTRGRKAPGKAQTAAGAASGAELRPVPAKAFSGRLLALAVVLLTITLLLAPSVRTFLQQRSEITALEQDIDAKKQQESDLKTELSRWSDPAYVKQQARDRVNMMMPGETGYWVYGGSGGPATGRDSGSPGTAGGSANPGDLPWVDGLWQSIKRSATE